MKSTLTYRFESGEHPSLEAVRITVTTITMKGIGTHTRLSREAADYWRADTHQDDQPEQPKENNNGEEEEGQRQQDAAAGLQVKPEDTVLYNQYMRWAALAVSTTMVTVIKRSKKTAELDEDTPDTWPWQDSSMSALGWDKPVGVLDLPVDLFHAWETQVFRVNPGIFGPPLSSGNAAKKKTGIVAIA